MTMTKIKVIMGWVWAVMSLATIIGLFISFNWFMLVFAVFAGAVSAIAFTEYFLTRDEDEYDRSW